MKWRNEWIGEYVEYDMCGSGSKVWIAERTGISVRRVIRLLTP